MDVTLLYFDGCPNWRVAHDRLVQGLAATGHPTEVILHKVETPADAEQVGFRGSPTILVDERDLFGSAPAAGGLACRVYPTDSGPQGSPSLDQILAALAER